MIEARRSTIRSHDRRSRMVTTVRSCQGPFYGNVGCRRGQRSRYQLVSMGGQGRGRTADLPAFRSGPARVIERLACWLRLGLSGLVSLRLCLLLHALLQRALRDPARGAEQAAELEHGVLVKVTGEGA